MDQLAALPDKALAAYADVLDVLQLTPWNGRPQHEANPDGAVRWWPFGPNQTGQIVYLIREEQHEARFVVPYKGAVDPRED
jgi:hypothetical protein